jgi:hypothetical protein
LTALIQKEEGIISQQASYMGKDNLKKKIAEVSLPFKRAVRCGDVADELIKEIIFGTWFQRI